MKLALLLALMIGTAHASFVQVSEYDQLKLAHFLGKLPSGIIERTETSLDAERKVKVTLAHEALDMNCESFYFGEAQVPSYSKCTIEIDINSPLVEKNYDEVMIKETNSERVAGLLAIMTGGMFRSGDWEMGNDITGRRTNIFTYLFSCSAKECSYKFSEKLIK